MSGITLKLFAFMSLTRLFPSILGNVVMIIVAVPLKGPDGKILHSDYAHRVEQLVTEVNEKHPGLVLYFEKRMPFAERTALFASSDVLVNSSLRHGLNLVPFEFVLCGSEKKVCVCV
jgi:trehalose-6-phosphate synthase